MADNVAEVTADDDFDVTADLAAAFDAAENDSQAPAAEPEGETAEQAAERVRDEKGRFAAKTEEKAEPEAKAAPVKATEPAKAAEQVKAEQAPVVDPLAPAEAVKPPPGFSPTAKVVWNKETLSKEEWEAVKRDIAKRNDEVDKGFAKFAEYKPVERFMEMAKQSGTTLDRALENYVGIEQDLRRDFVGGIARICQNQGISPLALANQILARNGVAPSEGQQGDQPQARQPAPVDPNAIVQSVREQIRAEQIQEEVNRSIKQFGSDPKNQFFENVRQDMTRLLQAGAAETLEDAYDKACWANPEIRNLLIKQQTVAASDTSAKAAAATQARAAAKSITGSPIPNASAKGPDISIEDEIRQLMDASV
jgi:hypothetical protein